MPALTNSPLFTALDVQDQLIAYLNADPYIQATILTQAGDFNPVVDDDPTPGSVDKVSNMRLIVTLASEGEIDADLGGPFGGSADVTNCFAVMLYVYEGDNRTIGAKRAIIRATGIVRQALMRYRQGTGTPEGGDFVAQFWWCSMFRSQGKDTTVYYTPKGCRLSVTMLETISRVNYEIGEPGPFPADTGQLFDPSGMP